MLEKLTGVKDWTEICREYRLRPQVFSRWWEELLKRAPEIVAGDRSQETHRRVGAHGQALDPRGGQKKPPTATPRDLWIAWGPRQHLDLSPERRREVIKRLADEYLVTAACAVLAMAQSSYYYRPVEAPDEARLKKALRQTATAWPTYGYRRLTHRLRRGGWVVTPKRVRRSVNRSTIFRVRSI